MTRIAALLLLVSAAYTQPRSRQGEYALILQDPPVAQVAQSRAALQGQAAAAHRQKVETAQRAVQSELSRRGVAVHRATSLLANAVYVDAATADPAELAAIRGVLRVQFLPFVTRDLNTAVDLVNVSAAYAAVGGASNAGAGVKIGIIDSGIDQTHPGFNDSGFSAPNGFPKGDTAYTNNKVIVARAYMSSLIGTNPESTTPDDRSPRDHIGHGTAIAMIAAGVQNRGPLATIQGVAPKAWLGNYKIFGSPGINEVTFDSTVGSALEDAIKDGMDIVTLSINEGDPANFGPLDIGTCEFNDPQAICDVRAQRIENATRLGLTVVASAGNSGNSGAKTPTRNSLHTPGTAPSAITVGATNNRHIIYQNVRYGSSNARGLFGDGTRPTTPLSAPGRDVTSTGDNGLACSPLPAGSLSKRIALIQRGTCYIMDKANNAQAAGAVAVVLMQTDGVETLPPTLFIRPTAIPVVTVGSTDAKAIKAFLAANADGNITLSTDFASADNPAVSQVAPFSSRGPSIGNFAVARDFALKPELVAPGVDVYTATQKYDPSGDAYHPSGYTTVSGTSYAVAFVAGSAAVAKQKNPNLNTPARLKSAVVNTASASALQGGPHLVDSGAGLLNVGDAVNVAATLDPAAISFGAPATLPVSRNLFITNVSGATATFTLNVRALSPESSSRVQVSPASVTLDPGATSQTITVSLTGTRPPAGSYEGFIDVTGPAQTPTLHLPYTYFVGSGVPDNVLAIRGGTFMGYPGDPGYRTAMRVTDAYGVPVGNAPTQFSVTQGGGKIEGGSTATDAIGTAAWFVDIGPQLGDQIFTATVGGLTQRFEGFARRPPTINAGGIVNSASFLLGSGIAPGSYITLRGTDLATTTGLFDTPYLPLAVASVSVSFDAANGTFPGRVQYVSPGQVNVVVPWELQGQTSARIKAIWTFDTNYWTGLVTVPVSQYSPGIFVITDANYLPIDSGHPAKRGESIILWSNGLGPTDVQPASGEPAPSTPPFANTKTPPTVTIGSATGRIDFSALSPGFIGLYQVNVGIPSNAPTGTQTLTLSIGGQSVTKEIPVQ